jgi:hypothetical protein
MNGSSISERDAKKWQKGENEDESVSLRQGPWDQGEDWVRKEFEA